MAVYIICFVWGILLGGVCTLLFFQSDKTWLKIFSSILGISGAGFSYNVIRNLTGETNLKTLQGGFAIMLVAIIIAILVVVYVMWKMLKGSDEDNIFRIRDVVFGKAEYIKQLYDQRIKEVEAQSTSKILEKEKKEIESLRADLLLKEQDLNTREDKLNEQIKHNVSLYLPVDAPIPMTNEFLRQFPDYIDGLAKFINDVNRFTEETLVKVTDNQAQNYNIVYSYFLGICAFMMEDVFDTTTKNVRIHFRVLHNNEYVKFVAKMGKFIYDEELTPIPKGRGMIKEAYINQTSLIKSLNSGHNFRSKHRNVWEDYMTISFYEISKDDEPFISMGISVRNKESFKHLLYFLNFFKIENLIQDNLYKIHKVYNIVETIENHYLVEDRGVI